MEERKLKYAHLRRPKEKVQYSAIAKQIVERTGFRECDVKEVLRTMIDCTMEHLKEKRSVTFPELGMLFPYIQVERKVNSMSGDENTTPMILPARWILKFKPGAVAVKELLKIEPTEEEIDELYLKK